MCVSPEKIIKSVLIVPAGIGNVFPIGSAKMMIPLLKYIRTKDEKYITETALFMSIILCFQQLVLIVLTIILCCGALENRKDSHVCVWMEVYSTNNMNIEYLGDDFNGKK